MEHTEEMSCSGIHSASMYMLQFPVGHLEMESIEELGPLWMESRLKPRTAAMDGMSICRPFCHCSFSNNMQCGKLAEAERE
jgi:hypothetical protein